MAKQLNVNLAFTANTSQAKTQIMELQKVLQQLGTGTNISGIAPEKIKQAATAAKELSYHLNQAYNSNTGNIDLSRLNASLSKSKTNVSALSSSLLQVGTNGQQAFIKLAQAISMADRPIVRTNGLLKELWVTMQNTMRWQLTSSVLHGFMGAIQKAYGYAQDLNESLNNIRIVTNNSAEQMAQFAEQANKAAKALNTTTTAYTNASLIYYQQGLTDQEVKERTDVTIKMANVSRQSAEIVSDQMTAVWNNFDNGSKSLEYYADVMTALGAATASSTDEISEGLEKFASVAETVGLSYEYATASLATVTATTRQSADVVGNAFKTLFARIQGLQLGETLDDGTTLNKYSKALDAVGIQIKDTNGEIKQMDTILNELGAKWNTLGKDQQIALAQTVAGVRQYTQLIALMDNWDFFQENLEVAYDSEGTLQEQADIYAESWEAARDRVRASLESIYSSVIDDEVFIKLTDFTGELVDSIDAVIDGIGGLKGVALIIGTVFTNLLSKNITPMMENLKQNLAIIIQGAGKVASQVSNQMNAKIQSELNNNETTGKYNTTQIAQLTNARNLTTARTKLMMVSDSLTKTERQLYQTEIDIIQLQQEESVAIAQKVDSLKLEEQQLLKNIEISGRRKTNFNDQKNSMVNSYTNFDDAEYIESQFDRVEIAANEAAQKIAEFYAKVKQNANESESLNLSKPYEQLKAVLNDLKLSMEAGELEGQEFKNILISVEQLLPAFKSLGGESAKTGAEIQNIFNALKTGARSDFDKAFDEIFQKLKQVTLTGEEAEQVLRGLFGVGFQKLNANLKESAEASRRLEESQRQLNAAVESFNPTHVVSGLQAITSVASGLGSVAMGLNAIKSIWTTWTNPDLSGFEKLTATLMSISMLVPSITSAFNMIKTTAQTASIATLGQSIALKKLNADQMQYAIISGIATAATKEDTETAIKNAVTKIVGSENYDYETNSIVRNAAAKGLSTKETMSEIIANLINAGKIDEATAARWREIFAIEAQTAANYKLQASMFITIGIMAAVAAAIAAIVFAYKTIKANSPEGQLKAVEKNTKALSQAAEEAKTNFENLLNTIDSYENAKAAIEDMTSSTEGFRDKIQEANQAARDLIETYGIASGYSIDDNGMIVFDDGVVEAAEQQEAKKAAEANFMAAGAQTYENQMALDVVKDQIVADFSENAISASYEELKTYTDNLFEFAKNSSNSAESLFGGVNKNFTVQEAFNDESFANLAKTVLGREDATSDNLTTDEFAVISKLIQNSNQYIDDLNNYQKQIVPNDNYKIALATEAIQQDSYLDNAFKEQTIDRAVADTITDETIANKVQELSFTEVMQSYMDKLGATDYKFNVATRSYSFTDEEGNEVGSGMNYEAIANSVASSLLLNDALGQIDEDSQEINNLTLQLKSIYGDQSNALIAAINGDMSSISEEMMGDWANFGFGDFMNLEGFPELVSLLGEDLTEIVSQLVNWKPEDYVPPTLQEQYNQIQTDKKAIEGLEYGEAIDKGIYDTLSDTTKSYFQLMSDGMYHLMADAEILQGILNEEETNNLQQQIIEANNLASKYGAFLNENIISYSPDKQTISDMATDLGMAEEYANLDFEDTEMVSTFLQNLFNALTNAIENGNIAQDTLDANALIEAQKYTNTEDERQAFLTAETETDKQAAREDLNAATYAGELGEQYNLAAENIERYAEALENSGKYTEANEKALVEMAKDQLRFDKAVENATENMESWEEALDTAADTGFLSSEASEEMAEAYGDLLDIDGDQLSDSFLKSTQNLEDMQKALEGDEEAYQRLQQAAQQDIEAQLHLEGNEEFQNALTSVKSQMDEINFTDLEVGASLDNQGFLDALSDMVTAAGMTADQATSYLSTMGIDAEVVQETGQPVKELSAWNLTPRIEEVSGAYGTGTIAFSGVTYEKTPVYTEKAPVATGLRVVSANKSSGGNTKFSGSNAARGGSSGGGGGGGSKKKDRKKYGDEIERYHEITEKIEDVTAEMEALADAKDRAFGADKLEILDQEIAKTEELIDAQKQYISEIEGNLTGDKAALAAYGAEFDASGRIINYDELMKQQIDKFNASRTEEAEEAYNEFIEILELYEETLNLFEEESNNLINLNNELSDKNLEKIEIKVNDKTESAEDFLEQIDFLLEGIEDDAYKAAKAIGLLGEQTKYTLQQMEAAETGLQDLLANKNLTDEVIKKIMSGAVTDAELKALSFTEDEISDIRDWSDALRDGASTLRDVRKEVEERILDAFDQWNEEMEDSIELFEYYNDLMESFKNIIDIVGKDMLGISDAVMESLDAAIVDNAVNKLAVAQDRLDVLNKRQIEAEEARANALAEGDTAAVEMWDNVLKQIAEDTREATEELMSNWEEALEVAADAFEQTIERVVASFEKAMSGTFGSFDALQSVFDQQSEISERYLADYQKIYELTKLNRNIQNSMDDTDNIKAKRALRDLQVEINELQESDTQMSQYDLDYLQKKYELKLAEIALEEAQNAKSQVRMTRDSEGNWSYTYTADQDKIDEAYQNYEDKLYEMQELNNEYIKETQNNILKSEIELANALRELDKAKFKTDAEYYAEVARITDYYTGQQNYYIDEANKSLNRNKDLYTGDWQDYSDATGYKISANEDYIDSFDETILSQITGYSTLEEVQNAFAENTQIMVNDMRAAFVKWQNDVERVMNAVDTTTAQFGDAMIQSIYGDGENPGIVDASNDAVEAFGTLTEDMTTGFDDIAKSATSFADTYSSAIDAAISKTEDLASAFNEVIRVASGLDENGQEIQEETSETSEETIIEDVPAVEAAVAAVSYPYGKASNTSGNITSGWSGRNVQAIQYALNKLGYGNSGTKNLDGIFGSGTWQAVYAFQKAMGIQKDGVVGSETRRAFASKGYKTGGLADYTGLAWLDGTPTKPELVLNPADTQNLLKTIELVDSLSKIIDLNAATQAAGLGMLNAISTTNTSSVLEQEVTIHAEFPNATDHNEIEMAFESLVNRASQFANRKNK